MFNGNFKEAKTLETKVPDFDAQISKLFVSWLYTQKLDLSHDEDEKEDGSETTAKPYCCNCKEKKDFGDDPHLHKTVDETGEMYTEKELEKYSSTFKRLRLHPVDFEEVAVFDLVRLADRYDIRLLRNATMEAIHFFFSGYAWLRLVTRHLHAENHGEGPTTTLSTKALPLSAFHGYV